MTRLVSIVAGLVLIGVGILLELTVAVLVSSGGCSPSPCHSSGVTTWDVVGAALAQGGAFLAFVSAFFLMRK
jgi:hypothetical protein